MVFAGQIQLDKTEKILRVMIKKLKKQKQKIDRKSICLNKNLYKLKINK